jgi:phosphate/phosphite/phosphonate ABC transporter binding protein
MRFKNGSRLRGFRAGVERYTRMVATIAAVVAIGIGLATPSAAEISLVFGTYTTDKPTDVVRKFHPILKYLGRELTQRMGEPVNIRLKIASDYDVGIADLVEGRVDIARFGPASYVIAKQQQPGIGILAMETVKGRKTFMGVIAVHSGSDIRKVADLRGRTFAFGNRLSTIGRYLAQDQLLGAGIVATDLAGFDYLQRHDRVGAAVGRGQFDAGALKQSTFLNLRKKGVPIQALVGFPNVTKPWLYRAGLPDRIVALLRAELVESGTASTASGIWKSGFIVGSDADYQFVRDAMVRSRDFGG